MSIKDTSTSCKHDIGYPCLIATVSMPSKNIMTVNIGFLPIGITPRQAAYCRQANRVLDGDRENTWLSWGIPCLPCLKLPNE